MTSMLTCADLALAFGGLKALKGVSLHVDEGEILGLVGPNGSGKTTLVNVVTGFYKPNSGRVSLFGRDVTGSAPHRIAEMGVARTFQNLTLFKGMSVLDSILLGPPHAYEAERARLAVLLVVGPARGTGQPPRGGGDHRVHAARGHRDEPVEVIPIGLQKRVELARALAAEPKFLILDEPMAGMNQEEKEYFARFILDARDEMGATILIIEHHMDVVTAICDRAVVLSYGEIIAEGEPRAVISTGGGKQCISPMNLSTSRYCGQRSANLQPSIFRRRWWCSGTRRAPFQRTSSASWATLVSVA